MTSALLLGPLWQRLPLVRAAAHRVTRQLRLYSYGIWWVWPGPNKSKHRRGTWFLHRCYRSGKKKSSVGFLPKRCASSTKSVSVSFVNEFPWKEFLCAWAKDRTWLLTQVLPSCANGNHSGGRFWWGQGPATDQGSLRWCSMVQI